MPNRLFVFKNNKFSPFFEAHPTVYLKNIEDHLMYYGSINPKNDIDDGYLLDRKLRLIYTSMRYYRVIADNPYILINKKVTKHEY